MRIKNIVIHANNHRNKQKKNKTKNTHTNREQANSDLRPTANSFSFSVTLLHFVNLKNITSYTYNK